MIRLDKINAIRHNSHKERGKINIVKILLSDFNSTIIKIEFDDFEHASQSVENLKNELEKFYNEQKIR